MSNMQGYDRFQRLNAFLKHRERVLNAKSVIQSRPAKNRPLPPRSSQKEELKKREEKRIEIANKRLMENLVRISERKHCHLYRIRKAN